MWVQHTSHSAKPHLLDKDWLTIHPLFNVLDGFASTSALPAFHTCNSGTTSAALLIGLLVKMGRGISFLLQNLLCMFFVQNDQFCYDTFIHMCEYMYMCMYVYVYTYNSFLLLITDRNDLSEVGLWLAALHLQPGSRRVDDEVRCWWRMDGSRSRGQWAHKQELKAGVQATLLFSQISLHLGLSQNAAHNLGESHHSQSFWNLPHEAAQRCSSQWLHVQSSGKPRLAFMILPFPPPFIMISSPSSCSDPLSLHTQVPLLLSHARVKWEKYVTFVFLFLAYFIT